MVKTAPSPQTILGRARYTVAQTARVAWYMSHYLTARRVSRPFDRPGEPAFRPKSQPGDQAQIRASFVKLFADDRANIEAGLYPPPEDFTPAKLIAAFDASRAFFQDLPKVDARRVAKEGVEVRRSNELAGRYPAYYMQNFHYQTGGWLTEESARLYDTQVEVLFGGAADAMRRIALGVFAEWMRGRDQRRVAALDLACGNGRFLAQMLGAFPKLRAQGVDLSPAYVEAARQKLAPWAQADVATGNVEHLPFDDAAFDAVTSVYLFHELPPRVRRDAAREIARVLKPGGALVFADSLQAGDHPHLDQMLEYFPVGFHEPFFGSYVNEDFTQIFSEAGLVLEDTRLAFLTKVMRFRRA